MSKRGGTASMIVASVCNEHKNSDLRANNPAILIAFNDRLEELEAERETLRERAEAAEAKLSGMKQKWRISPKSGIVFHSREELEKFKQVAIKAGASIQFGPIQSRSILVTDWKDEETV